MPSDDSYSITAKYYDQAYAAKTDLVDLPFYLELAREAKGPVLEIACGTGRVLLPIAKMGIEIHGVDNSAPMLEILKKHLSGESERVRQKVTLHHGDMRGFHLTSQFPLVMIPFRPMQHMHTVEDQLSALTTAAAHLGPEGILAFDVFYPKFDSITAKIGEEVLEFEWRPHSDSAEVVRRYFKKESVDKINQIFYFTFTYRTFQGDKLIREEAEAFQLSYFTYPHLHALFRLAGLEAVAEYGSFAKAPLDNNAEQMIFLLRKSQTNR